MRFSSRVAIAIDTTGGYWHGSAASDIPAYLAAYTAEAEAYAAEAYYPVQSPCGSDRFRLSRADSTTQRTCTRCERIFYVCRDGDPVHWDEAAEEEVPEPYRCQSCGSDDANVCLGFAGYAENPALDAARWFYVGVRCCGCGVLGCFNDGKVGRGPMGVRLFAEVAGESGGQLRTA